MSARQELGALKAQASAAAEDLAAMIETFVRRRALLEGQGERLEGRWSDAKELARKCRLVGGDSAADFARLPALASELQEWLHRQEEAEIRRACEQATVILGALTAIGETLQGELAEVEAKAAAAAVAAQRERAATRPRPDPRAEENRLAQLEAEREGRRDVLADWAARREEEIA